MTSLSPNTYIIFKFYDLSQLKQAKAKTNLSSYFFLVEQQNLNLAKNVCTVCQNSILNYFILTHSRPMFNFYSPWKQKNRGLQFENETEFESCSQVLDRNKKN